MKIKGIILAGGTGSRLYPITSVISKQLLPIYDKPMIYYPLSILMLAGIKEIAIVVSPSNLKDYQKLLGDGSKLGIFIKFFIQNKPDGLPEALNITESFIKNHKVCMILGDNIFYGSNFVNEYLKKELKKKGSSIFLYSVQDPSRFGIAEIDKNNQIKKIIEKPKKPKSNLAITGLYIFDARVTLFSRNLKLSKRGETEIVDLLRIYHKNNELNFRILNRGIAWIDTGTPESLINASQYIEIIEKRQNTKIACIEEISLRMNFIDKKRYLTLIKSYNKSPYKNYLKSILNK